MKLLSEYIKDIIEEKGHGVFASEEDWGIYISNEPSNPKRCISVFDTLGTHSPKYNYNPLDTPIEHLTFQLRIKGLSYKESYDKLVEVARDLEKQPMTIVDESIFHNMFRTTNYLYLGKIEDDTHIWTTNFKIIRNIV